MTVMFGPFLWEDLGNVLNTNEEQNTLYGWLVHVVMHLIHSTYSSRFPAPELLGNGLVPQAMLCHAPSGQRRAACNLQSALLYSSDYFNTLAPTDVLTLSVNNGRDEGSALVVARIQRWGDG